MKRIISILLIGAVVLLSISVTVSFFVAKSDALHDFEEQNSVSVTPSGDDQSETGTLPDDNQATEQRISFLAAGDIVLHESVFLDANLRAGGSGKSGSVHANSPYDFEPMFEMVKSAISAADFALVNQETLVDASSSGIPQGYPGFTGPRAAGDVLSKIGFDVVNIANNHMLDQGSAGLRRSMEYWQTQTNIHMIGAYTSLEECNNLLFLQKDGVKIALLTYIGQTPGTNGNSPDSKLYLPYLNETLVRSQMERARKGADCVLVTVHWGTEGTYSTNNEQTKYAQLFAELGADAVIGTHPHVLQPMQWMERTGYSKGGKMLLCYSLGDFLSHTQLAGGKNSKGNLLGGYVTFDIVKNADGVSLDKVIFTPTVSHYDKNTPLDINFCIYPLSSYTDVQLSRFGDTKAGFTSVSQLEAIVKLNIASEFLT